MERDPSKIINTTTSTNNNSNNIITDNSSYSPDLSSQNSQFNITKGFNLPQKGSSPQKESNNNNNGRDEIVNSNNNKNSLIDVGFKKVDVGKTRSTSFSTLSSSLKPLKNLPTSNTATTTTTTTTANSNGSNSTPESFPDQETPKQLFPDDKIYSTSASSKFTPQSTDRSDVKNLLSSHIESREREIERLTKVAEKNKLDSITYLNFIKDHKEQLAGYIKDFYEGGNGESTTEFIIDTTTTTTTDGLVHSSSSSSSSSSSNSLINNTQQSLELLPNAVVNRKQNIIEKSKALGAIEGTAIPSAATLSQSPIILSTSVTDTRTLPPPPPIQSMSFWDTPQQQHENGKESVSVLVSSYQNKDEELERVKSRSTSESMKAHYLREKYEELSQLVQSEKENWTQIVEKKKKEVDQKEKEICRLLMVAETQKKLSMDCTDQITRLKRSLSSISQLRGNNCCLDLKKLNEKFSVESLSSSPGTSFGSYGNTNSFKQSLPQSSSSSACSTSQSTASPIKSPVGHVGSPKGMSSSSMDYHHHHSGGGGSVGSKPSTLCFTEEKKELLHQCKLLERKEDEIKRIRDIIDYEITRTNYLSNKVAELKLMLEEESRQVETLQLKSLREMREKEDAILKVALRAQKDRFKANQLKEEIKKILKLLNYDDPSNKSKKAALDLDNVFIEMGDLNQFQNLSLSPYYSSSNSSNISSDENKNSQNQKSLHTINIYNQNNKGNHDNSNHPNNSNTAGKSPIIDPHINRINNNLVTSSICIPSGSSIGQRRGSATTLSDVTTSNGSLSPTFQYLSSYFSNQYHQHHHHGVRSPKIGTSAISMSPNVSGSSPSTNILVGSPTEIINFKLQEIERMSKVTNSKDNDLAKVKKIAEAERSRFSILKEKLRELRLELSRERGHHGSYSDPNICEKISNKIF